MKTIIAAMLHVEQYLQSEFQAGCKTNGAGRFSAGGGAKTLLLEYCDAENRVRVFLINCE